MLQRVVSRLPPELVRAVGRAQFRWPLLRKLTDLSASRLLGSGTIRHGVGAGLRFDATGGHPGYLLGTSEPDEQALLIEQLSPGDVFYDIGANIGFYSTLAARIVGPSGHVYAFEPFPESAARARRNALLNGFEHVTVEQRAVSDASGPVTLQLSPEGSAMHRLADGPGIEVDAVALDDWRRRSGIRPPDLVMIDVEGGELEVLRGMRETLADDRPVVCCEVHWLGDRFDDYCRDELAPLGYAVGSLDGRRQGRWHAVLRPT